MAIIIMLLIFLAKVDANLSNGMSLNSHAACPENGKQALLNFKKGFIDEANRIASWDPHHHPDCCRWFGVVCDNMTGHILSLNLSVPPLDEDNLISRLTSKLEGKINPCLSNLKHLRFLDLSGNQFEGLLPYQLGNLSNLQYLNLGDNGLYVQSLQWLSGLPLLKHLDLSSMDLSRASNWLQLVNTLLPSLEELHLSLCQLVPGPPLLNLNLSSLAILDLSYNDFSNQMDLRWVSKLNSLVLRLYGNELQGDISSAIFNIRTLSELDLSWNDPEEKLPRAAGKLCKLRSIDLSGIRLNQDISHIFEILSVCSSLRLESLAFSSCQLSGQLTDQLEHFKNLKELFLDSNSISGPIPTSLGQLANLEWVDIGNNLLESVVSEKHFANLTKLWDFRGSNNSLVLRVNPNWVPPFQILDLDLGSWQIGPSFPLWLRSQKHLEYLDISNSRISDVIPRWFWGLSTQFRDGNLSRNQISGQIQYLPQSQVYFFVDLSFNNFSGPLPRISVGPNMGPFFAGFVKLSNNYFSGSLFHFLCYQGNDTLPMVALSLANNLLSGEIPDCWIKWQYLRVLRLDGNRVSGKIPISMGTLTKLQSLHLHNNRLHGEIPLSLKNCTNLVAINFGENELNGHIPGWMDHSLPNLIILILRSNKFGGNIPDHLCALSSLKILDLSNSHLFGCIPRCISNFAAMVRRNASRERSIIYNANIEDVYEYASVVMKGQFLEYGNTLNLVRLVDLSRNNLSGEIPQEVVNLQALQTLNLSQNHLTGKIPKLIGAMILIETMDLSQNQLTGSIPESISGSGKETDVKNRAKGIRKGREINWFYVSMPLGFVTGFWCVLGPLVFDRRWRITYYRVSTEMWWKAYDFVGKF
ncbi:hypothetical protein ES319_A10G147600v1 [Gossypium barbadense]|uniref:Leucine-rich repeat-containing N-terminal plant-type domain-containing protein n=1 Tax=Gossypium barbadense TaxID=3634 RepID=A0A5J5U3Y8_GOSBA|nr:hypothetical protein ES319_A10G147600v1 [Gossypium barbadense]